ncbi:hypothetical protein J3E71DRAFT_178751 [Bipolaris maydis]|nr:hypothetical protein J3E71DRAFT_178751 [Bipolaris maydis]
MSLLSALDAQDHNSSSANEESSRTPRTRVPRACNQCRAHKMRCDGNNPCDGCVQNCKECMYQDVQPTKYQKSLTSMHNILTAAYKELRDIHHELGGLNRGHLNLHFIPLNPEREHGTGAFLRKELHRLSESYVRNVHALYPFFNNPQEMCNEFINDPVVQRGIIMPSLRNAHVLLFFALGSCRSITNNTGSSSTLPGEVYYSHAKAILRHTIGEWNTHVAQALTLATLYTNQNGMLLDSLAHLCNAHDIYADVFKNSTSFSEEAKMSFWIHQDLARSLSDCSNLASSNRFPEPCDTLLSKGNVGQFPERVYWTKVTLRILLDALCEFARPYFPKKMEIDEEDLCALGSVANKQIEMLEEWRSKLISQLAWDDTEPPSTDPLIASLRAEYYEGMAKLLRPYVGYALHADIHSTGNESSKGQQGILKVLFDWEKHALSSIVCFDRVGAASDSTYEMYQKTGGSPVMMSNPVSTLHAQLSLILMLSSEFKIVFLCRVVRSSTIYPLIVEQTKLTDTTMDTLRRRTTKKLSEFFPSHEILCRDLEALNRLWSSGDSVPLVELVRAYELV